MEDRTGLVVDMCVTQATGTAERETALALATNLRPGATLGADEGYDTRDFVAALRELGVTRTSRRTRQSGAARSMSGRRGTRAMTSARRCANGWKRSSAGSRP